MNQPLSRLHKLCVAFLLLFSLTLGLFLAHRDSLTTDEGIHVASSYLAMKRGEFRFDPEHPFLYKTLTALPLLPLNLNMPPRDAELWEAGYATLNDSWQDSREWTDEWFYNSGNNTAIMVFLMRIPAVLVMVAFCWLVYFLAKKWFSPRVGLFALAFTVLNPTVIAHGHLANNDVAAALGFLGTLWGLWYYWEKPSAKRAAILALCFAAAQITKFSLITLVPIVLVWLAYTAHRKAGWKQVLKHTGLIALITLAVIWAAYLMPLYLIQGTAFQIKGSTDLPPLVRVDPTLFKHFLVIRYILPIDYVKGLLLILGGSYEGRPTYLLGSVYATGTHVWSYFPVVYFLKTQIIGLVLLVMSAIIAIMGIRKKQGWLQNPLFVLIFLALVFYGGPSLANKINIGVRHILPLMSIFSIAMALALDWLVRQTNRRHIATGALALYALPLAFSFPNYLGFSNAFVHPYTDAYRYYGDSNLDWGQQAKDIARVMRDEFPGETLHVNYRWNPYALNYYGVKTERLDNGNLPVGSIIAITATDMPSKEYAPLRRRPPAYVLANNTFFFRAEANDRF